mmetsp:Transcript_119464/g.381135  ORF Transcript_119464/g.381135 Transcript_119464/m.381135 type:complete len:209 (+) Transcript_119464:1105-1731(+)
MAFRALRPWTPRGTCPSSAAGMQATRRPSRSTSPCRPAAGCRARRCTPRARPSRRPLTSLRQAAGCVPRSSSAAAAGDLAPPSTSEPPSSFRPRLCTMAAALRGCRAAPEGLAGRAPRASGCPSTSCRPRRSVSRARRRPRRARARCWRGCTATAAATPARPRTPRPRAAAPARIGPSRRTAWPRTRPQKSRCRARGAEKRKRAQSRE